MSHVKPSAQDPPLDGQTTTIMVRLDPEGSSAAPDSFQTLPPVFLPPTISGSNEDEDESDEEDDVEIVPGELGFAIDMWPNWV